MIDLDELERMVAASNARITRDEMCLRDMEWVTEHVLSNILPALIERVRKAEEALKPFSNFAERFGDTARDDDWVLTRNPSGKGDLTMGNVRRARAHFAAYEPAKEVEK